MSGERARFSGQIALVTGAASGIGLAVARALGLEGARVLLADLRGEQAESAAKELREAGAPDAWGVACDVSQEDQVEACVRGAIDRAGHLDVIVNNAGLMVFKPLEEQTADDWWKVLRVDLLGAFFFIRAAFRTMRRGGAIVNVSSIHAVETTPLVCSYAAAKAALLSLTRSAALEGKARGLRVNAVLPGAVDTPMLWTNPNIVSGLERPDPKEIGKPEQIAEAVLFLASPEASFVQGAALRVDGGRLDRL